MTELGTSEAWGGGSVVGSVVEVQTEVPAEAADTTAVLDRPLEQLPTVEEAMGSLTGFDEIAVKQRFGSDLLSLDPLSITRAVAFVLARRAGMDDHNAYLDVMGVSIKAIEARFASEEAAGVDPGKA